MVETRLPCEAPVFVSSEAAHRGQDERGAATRAAEPARHLVSVDPGQGDVEKHEFRVEPLDERKRFLGETVENGASESPLASALVVGVGYAAGALVPLLPVLFGARSVLPTVLAGGVVIVVVSAVVAFLSGMDVRRRMALNLGVTGIAVVVTYGIGLLAKAALGVGV